MPYAFGSAPDFQAETYRMKQVKKLYKTRRTRNWPFGITAPLGAADASPDPGASPSASRKPLLSLLPPRFLADEFVENYLFSFERTYRLLHVPTFRAELDAFWEDSASASDGWVSQLFMMLALGCQSNRSLETGGRRGAAAEGLVDDLLDGAERALHRSRFMYKPTLDDLRALLMMALAKQIDIVANDGDEGLWVFIGLVERLAIVAGLHKDPSHYVGMPVFEMEMRRRIWTTVVQLDVQFSIRSGMPLLLRQGDADVTPPADIDDEAIWPEFDGELPVRSEKTAPATEATFQHLLARSFPTVLRVVQISDLAPESLNHSDVLKVDAELRQHIQDLFDVPLPGSTLKADADPLTTLTHAPAIALNIFYRRCMLSLHVPYLPSVEYRIAHLDSYRAVLEAAMALVVVQRSLYENQPDGGGAMEWFAELFKDDFGTAAFLVCLGLRRSDFSLMNLIDGDGSASGAATPEDTVASTLDACLNMLAARIDLSADHFKAHMGLSICIGALRSSMFHTSLHAEMVNAVERTIGAVTARWKERGRELPAWLDIDAQLEDPLVADGLDDMDIDNAFAEFWYL